jgi:acetylornithine deacetylase/succinyl-diaminopimelate desuccinylase-like protein
MFARLPRNTRWIISVVFLLSIPPDSTAQNGVAYRRLARDIFRELIETNTTASVGDNTKAAELIAARFRSAGFPPEDVQLLAPAPRKGNLVVRLRGGAQKPLLWLAHLDVVEAKKEDWSWDPFQFVERDGYFYGRGAYDNKAGVAILVTTFLRLKQEGYKPDRDLILALTADEETPGQNNGVNWLVAKHRDLINAMYCINSDSGDGQMRSGKRILSAVQVGEKGSMGFSLEVKNPGGHSSIPRRDNAIYRLADALTRLSKFEFPIRLNPATRMYFERMAMTQPDPSARDMRSLLASPPDRSAIDRLAATPYYNALMRTTCVATRLEGGHASNALPQSARATINCRLLPDESPDEVIRTLRMIIADESVTVTPSNPLPGSLSPLAPELLAVVSKIAAELWPGVPVVPDMEPGGTDGRYLRPAGIPTYGISGLFDDIDDVRAHGKDERIAVPVFYEGLEFHYLLAKALTGKQLSH